MGAEPWWYYVKYQVDVEVALKELRQREFVAGRYNPVVSDLEFPVGDDSPSPGAQHASIDEAREGAGEEGTCSILDIVSTGTRAAICVACALDDDILDDLYGTTTPTREQVERDMDFFDEADRGMGIYIVLYRDGRPDEILFAGYSFD